ncbi:MAG: hypothetical protein H5T86_03665 [Armatimonadetes bacterium]|nr:hypothetical protein [Armatimonadota bacterium]
MAGRHAPDDVLLPRYLMSPALLSLEMEKVVVAVGVVVAGHVHGGVGQRPTSTNQAIRQDLECRPVRLGRCLTSVIWTKGRPV